MCREERASERAGKGRGREREREVEGRKRKTEEEYGLEVGGKTEISNWDRQERWKSKSKDEKHEEQEQGNMTERKSSDLGDESLKGRKARRHVGSEKKRES